MFLRYFWFLNCCTNRDHQQSTFPWWSTREIVSSWFDNQILNAVDSPYFQTFAIFIHSFTSLISDHFPYLFIHSQVSPVTRKWLFLEDVWKECCFFQISNCEPSLLGLVAAAVAVWQISSNHLNTCMYLFTTIHRNSHCHHKAYGYYLHNGHPYIWKGA